LHCAVFSVSRALRSGKGGGGVDVVPPTWAVSSNTSLAEAPHNDKCVLILFMVT
jgi:hypothetical protein